MAHYRPDHRPQVEPEDAATVVHDFLSRCRSWATEREIPKRLARVADGADAAEAARLHAWVVWREFIDHALQEVEDGTLDAWFEPVPDGIDD